VHRAAVTLRVISSAAAAGRIERKRGKIRSGWIKRKRGKIRSRWRHQEENLDACATT
jgi:hypothetical protein